MNAVDLLREMVAMETVSARPVTAMAARMAEHAEASGFTVERFETGEPGKANVVCTLGPPDADGLVLSGHMDVVPVDGQPWTSPPFRLTERGDRLVGRGTADMKGFLAATCIALDALDLRRLRRQLVLVWTCDEETGCSGSRILVDQLAGLDRRLPRQALIGEPTDFRMLRQHAGHVGVTIETRGEAAHSSMPWLGANAVNALARIVVALEQLAAELHPVPMNAALLSAGEAINIVPDQASLTLGYRPQPGQDVLAVYQRVRTVVASTELPEGTSATVTLGTVTPSLDSPEGLPLQGLLTPHACSPATGCAPFATDGGNLAALGVDSIVFGPGSISVAHKADEYVTREALERGVEIVRDVVLHACG